MNVNESRSMKRGVRLNSRIKESLARSRMLQRVCAKIEIVRGIRKSCSVICAR